MSNRSDKMRLLLFVAPMGYQPASWRHPESRVEELYSLELQRDIARRAEEAKLHAIFLADWLSFGDTGVNPDLTGYEPFTTLGALSAVTDKIGLIGTASTTFNEPFNVARYFSQLDFLSKGRVGWNIVTSSTGEENYTIALPPRDERYSRAVEFMQAVTRLWDAWEDDAVLVDRKGGKWANNNKIHPIYHQGQHYRVQGPLFVPRSPQAWPVLVQAGGSTSGMQFAARFAEVIFTVKATLEAGREFYTGVRTLAVEHGRGDNPPTILPGLMPIVGKTEAEAREIHESLSDLIDLETGRNQLSELLAGADLTDLGFEDRIPVSRLATPAEVDTKGGLSRYPYFYHLATEEQWSVQQLVREATKALGHGMVVGSAEQVADHMQSWFHNGAADGFAILPPTVPAGLDRFLDDVVPILQDRGIFRREYIDGTLRDNLGLNRPVSPHR